MTKTKNRQAIMLTLVLAAAAIWIIILVFAADTEINNANLEFIRAYGWQVEEKPADISHMTVPEEFDAVYSAFYSMEKTAGFDLARYKGIKATRYSYRVLNHAKSDTGMIRADVFTTADGVIAADICSVELGGFIAPISDISEQITY